VDGIKKTSNRKGIKTKVTTHQVIGPQSASKGEKAKGGTGGEDRQIS